MDPLFFILGILLLALNTGMAMNNIRNEDYYRLPVNFIGIIFSIVTIILSII